VKLHKNLFLCQEITVYLTDNTGFFAYKKTLIFSISAPSFMLNYVQL